MPPVSSCVAEAKIHLGPATSTASVHALVRTFARGSGASVRDEWCLAIAASEVTTNVQKFARSGLLTLRLMLAPRRTIEMVAEDDGPGLRDVESALRDGVSEGVDLATVTEPRRRRRGLGTGLGALRRAMDELRIEVRPEGGTRLVARRYLER